MTKKDYLKIAEVLKIYVKAFKSNEEHNINYSVTGSSLVREISFKIMDMLKKDNPKFDKNKFCEFVGL